MAKKPYDQKAPPCYTTHKPLQLAEGLLYGGNCAMPMAKDADNYIALEALSPRLDVRAYPWVDGSSFVFPISNGQAPQDRIQFEYLIAFLCSELSGGRTAHVGCIGGHGRTGMVLAAVVRELLDRKDATAYVREHYCFKAVETQAQVDFLEDVFGIEPVVPYYNVKLAKA